MAFQLGEEDSQPINEMNLIPLIDIMLVLMIVFMLTATALTPSIPLNLPTTTATIQPPAKDIQISIDKNGKVFWGNQSLTQTQLQQQLHAQATQPQPPTIQLRADKAARYESVAQVLALASEAGLTKIAFVSE